MNNSLSKFLRNSTLFTPNQRMIPSLSSDTPGEGKGIATAFSRNHRIKPEHRFHARAALMTFNDTDPVAFYKASLGQDREKVMEGMNAYHRNVILFCPKKTHVYLRYLSECLVGLE